MFGDMICNALLEGIIMFVRILIFLIKGVFSLTQRGDDFNG